MEGANPMTTQPPNELKRISIFTGEPYDAVESFDGQFYLAADVDLLLAESRDENEKLKSLTIGFAWSVYRRGSDAQGVGGYRCPKSQSGDKACQFLLSVGLLAKHPSEYWFREIRSNG
jgi:hypothetical protein